MKDDSKKQAAQANMPVRSLHPSQLLLLPFLALIALSFFLGTSEFVVVGILPELADGFHVSLTAAGSVVTAFAFTYALGTPFLAAMAGRYIRFRYMMVLMVIFSVANLFSAFAPNFALFVLARMVTAVVSGTLVSIALTFAPNIAPPSSMAMVISGIFSGFSVASVFGVPIATSITHLFGWRASFLFIFGASLLLIALLFAVLPRRDHNQAQGILQQFRLFRDQRILLGCLTVICGAGATYTFYTYLSPIFQTELGIPVGLTSAALLVFGIAAILSNLGSGIVAARWGLSIMPRVYAVQLCFMLLLTFVSGHFLFGAAVIFVLGVLMYLMNSPIQLHFLQTAEEAHPDCVNLASSLNSVFFNFGIAFGSFCGGQIVAHAGLRFVGLGGSVLAGLACFLCLMTLRTVRRQDRANA